MGQVMLKRIIVAAVMAAALTGCGMTTSRPKPIDTATPPVSPVMDCTQAQAVVSDTIANDPGTMSGQEIRRHVLAAGSIILANSSCFSPEMVTNAVESFRHEGLNPLTYGYSGE